MKRIIAVLAALALAFPAYAVGNGKGNQGNGVGNTGPGNQGNDKPVGNAGGDKGPKHPKGPKGETPATTETSGSTRTGGSGGFLGNGGTELIGAGVFFLGAVCQKERERADVDEYIAYLIANGATYKGQPVTQELANEVLTVQIDEENGGGQFVDRSNPFVAALCTQGEMNDPFESYVQ